MVAISQSNVEYYGRNLTGLFDPNISTEQRIEKGADFINSVFITAAYANAQEEANEKIRQNEEKNNNWNTAANNQAETNKKAIETITNKITENENKIKEILEAIKGLEEKKDEINQKVLEHKIEIEKQKKRYNDAVEAKDRTEQRKALDAISEEGKAIQGLLSQAETLSKEQQNFNEQGEQYKSENISLQTESEETVKEGQDKLNAINVQAAANKAETAGLSADAAKYAQKAAEYTAKAMALKTGGTLTGLLTFGASSVASEAAAAELTKKAAENTSASATITQGIGSILPVITSTISEIQTNNGYLVSSGSALNSLTTSAGNDAETFDGISNAVGRWFDSTQNWKQVNENIQTAVDTAYNEVSEEESKENSENEDSTDKNNNEKRKLNADTNFQIDAA